ncbi:glycoside hydrolase family 47 protein [Laetiporus sulphureus 93-53]|uniref:alpha-1,2-Mannosidase n=1 Tax=Laetiporus sulphureus 93-53 TaxID=1314785 RepID=A0A165BJM3_9APHY|nr:glycoside hydrolase family 47 protein [Laetiporus sulphureus 93-53]KZT01183.1 glycoside hydrolase family 47 protein [Laetiporus sulphureus 93-53]
MAEPGVRKRKFRKTFKPAGDEAQATNATAQTSSDAAMLKTVFLVILLTAGIWLYKNYDYRSFFRWRKQQAAWDFDEESRREVKFTADVPKRDAILAAFKHAWSAYERDAMGDDEYHPIGKSGTNLTEAGGIGYTVVDSIDTMLIMGLDDEYARARQWVAEDLSFERDGSFNTFETTIRVLGGLLSAYHLTGDTMYLERATDLADRITPVFSTPTGLPHSMVNLAHRKGVPDKDNRGLVSTAEVSTLQLEFKYLSYLTDESEYWKKVEKVMEVLKNARIATGLASIFVNPNDGKFAIGPIRLGSRGDSYYEYLLKQYIQTGSTELVYRQMYDDAMLAVHTHLMRKSEREGLTYTAEILPERDREGRITWRMVPKQDHLVCFFGGSLMLGATVTGATTQPVSIPPRTEELTAQGKRDWLSGIELIKTCMATHETATGLSPEIVHFRVPGDGIESKHDWYIKGARPGHTPYDARYILRPETVESLFIAYRLTGHPQYREWGWNIFQAIEKYCKVESGGYASVLNVDEVPVQLEDKMETFLMSETLKYLYLLFSDDTILPLSDYVFNTEAHPFPIFHPTLRTGFF